MSILSDLLVDDGSLPRRFTAVAIGEGSVMFKETDSNGDPYVSRIKSLTSVNGQRAVAKDEKTDVITVNAGFSPWINGDGYLSFGSDDNRPASAADVRAAIVAK